MLRQRSNRNEASSDRALGKSYALLALAVLVYGCDFELEVSGFPVSLVLHAVGLAAVAAATLVFRRHRGSSAGTWLLVGTVLLALDLGAFLADHFAGSSRALELLVAAAPALRLAGLLALVAGLGGDAAGREWERAARAWRWTLLAALGIYALPFAALFLAALVWGELDYTSHSLGFLALMLAVLGLPYALGLHALACTRSELDAHLERRPGFLTTRLARPRAIPVLLLLFLAPVGLILPAYVHHATTPTFDEAVATAPPGGSRPPATAAELSVLSEHGGPLWSEGTVEAFDEDDYPGDAATAGFFGTVRLHRGGELLVELEPEILTGFDPDTNRWTGTRVSWGRARHDRRFQLAARAYVDFEREPRRVATSPGEQRSEWRGAVALQIVLEPGSGAPELQTLFADGLRPLLESRRGPDIETVLALSLIHI